MWRYVRIVFLLAFAAFVFDAVRSALGFRDELFGPGFEGLVDLALFIAVLFLLGFRDRTFFRLSRLTTKHSDRHATRSRGPAKVPRRS